MPFRILIASTSANRPPIQTISYKSKRDLHIPHHCATQYTTMKLHMIMIGTISASVATAAFAMSRGSCGTVRSSSTAFVNSFSRSGARKSTTAAYVSPIDYAKTEIASNDVVVFSKTYCPFCTATKQLFGSMSIDAKVIELDQMENGAEVQSALLDLSGQRTVPNVFIKGQHLGGNDVTQAAAKNGKLKEMLGN